MCTTFQTDSPEDNASYVWRDHSHKVDIQLKLIHFTDYFWDKCSMLIWASSSWAAEIKSRGPEQVMKCVGAPGVWPEWE